MKEFYSGLSVHSLRLWLLHYADCIHYKEVKKWFSNYDIELYWMMRHLESDS